MLYFCIPAYNESPTIGLLLWRLRKVFQEQPREYEVLVYDDGSTDATTDTLAPYHKVMPLTVLGGKKRMGYAPAVDALCREASLASGLVDLGGDLAVVGPHPDGSPWQVGIRNPRRPSEAIARIALSSGGIATSGDYERCMVVDGVRYSHLLDPRTGESFRGGPASVSVTAPLCLVAGAATTIAMLHAEAESAHFLAELGLPHLVICQDGSVTGDARRASRLRREDDEIGVPAVLA